MRAVMVTEPGAAVPTEVPDPRPGPGEVVVRVDACGLCGTDMHILDGELPSARYPLVPGHELAGEVVECGPGATGVAVGTRVAVDPNMPCGACHYCRIGRGNLCDDYTAVGVTRDGGFAELVAVPARCCHPLPEALSPAAAGLVEPLACAVHAVGRLPRRPGEHYLIYGAGTMGLMMSAVVRHAGAASVSMVDPNEERLAFAKGFGADAVATGAGMLDRPQGFEVVIDATGVVAAIEDGLGRVRKGGTFLQFGVADPAQAARLSPFRVYNAEIDIIGSMAVHHGFQPAIDLLAAGLDLDPLVSDVFGLDQFDEAVAAFRAGTGRKIHIDPARRTAGPATAAEARS
ncbi:zinc-dependent alcohol dehydrogenase family protein [Streptantibioticus cattleyicolor]|uniref:2-deoxy-scyllo-inosamine dehydrogenase n=1 Tax=Streptantibioticus cattleyicolor (strain ATCC 35852 / DSM 46488 / JCM 4925 / NBRC 14057 / NRRL 8057) TaxID=1003195 RepID=F8JJE3_STREN|nr:zinc-dependent alcohol dehydrogenase family protein [Streptantibioticus cattleyicolor]AEW98734.1 Alcohol dehydrogenase GroES domain protein [Streptantibioticus cattleyicolor NRRL 8057 = DSM 46488]CCB72213.1 putative zinc-binding dehydrogenase [Streptantibioticus cattleyicolor NRRL 8057 = DSM 46488]